MSSKRMERLEKVMIGILEYLKVKDPDSEILEKLLQVTQTNDEETKREEDQNESMKVSERKVHDERLGHLVEFVSRLSDEVKHLSIENRKSKESSVVEEKHKEIEVEVNREEPYTEHPVDSGPTNESPPREIAKEIPQEMPPQFFPFQRRYETPGYTVRQLDPIPIKQFQKRRRPFIQFNQVLDLSLYIGRIPEFMGVKEIRNYFQQKNISIDGLKVPFKRFQNFHKKNRGFGFIRFRSSEDLDRALSLQGNLFDCSESYFNVMDRSQIMLTFPQFVKPRSAYRPTHYGYQPQYGGGGGGYQRNEYGYQRGHPNYGPPPPPPPQNVSPHHHNQGEF